MSDELVEYLAEAMHGEWFSLQVERGAHAPSECPLRESYRQQYAAELLMGCDGCLPGLMPWSALPEEVKEVNRRGARRFLKEVGLSPKAQRGAVGRVVEALERIERSAVIQTEFGKLLQTDGHPMDVMNECLDALRALGWEE